MFLPCIPRDDDNDRSDEEDDEDHRIDFSSNQEVEQRKKVRADFLAMEQGDSDGERDEEFERWEKEQIRKGVSIPQVREFPTMATLLAFYLELSEHDLCATAG